MTLWFESSALNTSNYMETASELPKLGPRLKKKLIIKIVPADPAEPVEISVNASTPWRWLKTSRAPTKMRPYSVL